MRWESQYDYLMHYGVKGQKHGVRRYQNDDGTLTAEGRDHYGVGDQRRAGGPSLHAKQGRTEEIKSLFKRKNKASGGNETEEETKKSKDSESKTAKNSGRLKKILAVAAAASLASVAAYSASKHIKAKANDLLAREYKRNTKTALEIYKGISKNINDGGYDFATSNALHNQIRRTTNANLAAESQYYDQQRSKNDRSTREALKFIRSRR